MLLGDSDWVLPGYSDGTKLCSMYCHMSVVVLTWNRRQHGHACICELVFMYVCMYVCMHVCMYVCIHTYIYIYIHVCACVCVGVCARVCVCVCSRNVPSLGEY